jgi:hypothetical protein
MTDSDIFSYSKNCEACRERAPSQGQGVWLSTCERTKGTALHGEGRCSRIPGALYDASHNCIRQPAHDWRPPPGFHCSLQGLSACMCQTWLFSEEC